MKKITVAVSGYFDPIHIGHIECLELAKKLGDKLLVIINTDEQAIKKKRYVFMPLKERMKIVKSLKVVDEVVASIDTDASVCKTLEMIKPNIFAKGGDRNTGNIPEAEICKKIGCKIIDGLGAKVQSSSELVKKSKEINKL